MRANTAKRSSRHKHIKHINEMFDSFFLSYIEEEAQALRQILEETAPPLQKHQAWEIWVHLQTNNPY